MACFDINCEHSEVHCIVNGWHIGRNFEYEVKCI